MTVGSLGDVTFSTDEKKLQTIRNLSWKSTANYTTHKLVGKKGILEFTGLEPDEITFEIYLSAFFGVNPETMLNKLEKMWKKGTKQLFILGTKQVGDGPWVITSMSRAAEHHYKDGTVETYTVNITIKETGEAQSIGSSGSSSSSSKTGWKKESGKWYYYKNGKKVKGWKKVGGKWYYMNKKGVMQTGWQKVDGVWYYLASDGAMQTGWVKDKGKWYYMDGNGAMHTGWLKDGNYWYYLESDGHMLASTSKTISGKLYYFDADGHCTNP